MSQPLAHYRDNHHLMHPQPKDGERDCFGHFKGCIDRSCGMTRCRELWSGNSGKNWYWSTTAEAKERRAP